MTNLCPKGHPLEKREGTFYYRGRAYVMDYCPVCGSTYGLPSELLADHAAGVFNGTEPGDMVA